MKNISALQKRIIFILGVALALDLFLISNLYEGEIVRIEKGPGYGMAGLRKIDVKSNHGSDRMFASEEALHKLRVGDAVSIANSLLLQRNKFISRDGEAFSSLSIPNIFLSVVMLSCFFIACWGPGGKKFIDDVEAWVKELSKPAVRVVYMLYIVCFAAFMLGVAALF